MAIYRYRGITRNGQIISNKVEEASRFTLIKKLKSNDIIPIEITQTAYGGIRRRQVKKRNTNDIDEIIKNVNNTKIEHTEAKKLTLKEKANLYLGTTDKVTNRDLVIFTQDLYMLKKANFNNIHALETIIKTTENMTLRSILEDILAGLENGEYMYTTMEYYSNIFPFIYINMIKVGELSGSLMKSLEQAVEYLDDTDRINRELKHILVPNLLQFFGLLIMLIVGTLFAIPQIQNLYDEIGTEATLPKVTIWFQGVVNIMMQYWFIPVIVILALVAAIIFYINTPKGKYNFHYFKYTMPVFGKLIFALDFSRVLKGLKLNVDNGMRIQEALEVSKNVAKNYVMLSIIETSINNMVTGYSWIDPFEKSGLASPMITEMLGIGMQTDLTEMLDKLIEYMEIDIHEQLNKIMKVLPQIVYAIVGVVLIFFVLVVLVPCLQVYMGNFLFSAYL
ncbi:MAG: type II secretion system F family protein [Clostridia bacterium]|nr:type II secretion system F family protein [Clostridia bacterium]